MKNEQSERELIAILYGSRVSGGERIRQLGASTPAWTCWTTQWDGEAMDMAG